MADLTVTHRDIWHGLAQLDPAVTPPLALLRKADVPIRVSNNIRKLVRKAAEVFPDIAEQRDALIAKHAQRDEAGNPVLFDDGKQTALADADAYLKDLDELMALPVVLADVRPIFLSEIATVKLSADALDALGGFLVDDEGLGAGG